MKHRRVYGFPVFEFQLPGSEWDRGMYRNNGAGAGMICNFSHSSLDMD